MYQLKSLKEKPHYLKRLIDLIEGAYGYNKHNSYLIDFYPLLKKENWKNCQLILSNDSSERLIGHIGFKSRLLKTSDGMKKCMFIGGIAIENSFRGFGIFKNSFNEILNINKNLYSYAFLWSEKIDLYKKYGFNKISDCVLKLNSMDTVSNLIENGYEKTKLCNVNEEYKKQIYELYESEISDIFLCPERDATAWSDIESIKSMDLMIKLHKDKVVSYCMVGKGQDLENIIHEFACSGDYPNEIEVLQNNSILLYKNYKIKSPEDLILPTALVKNFNNDASLENEILRKPLFISGADSI